MSIFCRHEIMNIDVCIYMYILNIYIFSHIVILRLTVLTCGPYFIVIIFFQNA